MSQILSTSQVDGVSDQVLGEVDGFNFAISTSKHSWSLQPTTKKTYPLGPTLLRCLQERTTSELLEGIRFFCLDIGCQHARGESYMATGILDIWDISDS